MGRAGAVEVRGPERLRIASLDEVHLDDARQPHGLGTSGGTLSEHLASQLTPREVPVDPSRTPTVRTRLHYLQDFSIHGSGAGVCVGVRIRRLTLQDVPNRAPVCP